MSESREAARFADTHWRLPSLHASFATVCFYKVKSSYEAFHCGVSYYSIDIDTAAHILLCKLCLCLCRGGLVRGTDTALIRDGPELAHRRPGNSPSNQYPKHMLRDHGRDYPNEVQRR